MRLGMKYWKGNLLILLGIKHTFLRKMKRFAGLLMLAVLILVVVSFVWDPFESDFAVQAGSQTYNCDITNKQYLEGNSGQIATLCRSMSGGHTWRIAFGIGGGVRITSNTHHKATGPGVRIAQSICGLKVSSDSFHTYPVTDLGSNYGPYRYLTSLPGDNSRCFSKIAVIAGIQ